MAGSDSKRAQRVGEQIKQELAQLLVEEVKDPRVGFATVTEVRASGDLRNARVYVSLYGTAEERSGSLEGLHAAAGYLRRELGHRLRLKYTPELAFVQDETLDHAERLDELLVAAAHGDAEPPQDDARPVVPIKTARSELAERAETYKSESPRPQPERRSRARRTGSGRRKR